MFPHADPLLILAVVVVAGLAGGAVARQLKLAGVTGQILAGVLIGHAGFGLFLNEDVHGLEPVTQFALGLITVLVGGHLNLRRLRNAGKRLGFLLLGEVIVTPLVVYAAVVYVSGETAVIAVLLAAMAISTAPATVVALVAETKSKGVFVKTLLGAVALDNIACIASFEMARLAARVALDDTIEHVWIDYVVQPLRQVVLAGLLGAALGAALVVVTRHVFRGDRLNTASLLTVLLAIGLARGIEVSPLLTCLFLGMTLANLTPDKDEIVESAFVNVRGAIFAVFFTLAGMHLDLDEVMGSAGMLAVVVVVARALGKAAGARVALNLAGATDRMQRYIGLALVPQAGVAVGLLLLAQDDPALATIAPFLLNVGLAVVTINEIIGPFCVRHALVRSGEAGHDRERLIDFLHEENIVTGLQAETKEEAIEQLVNVLIRSNHLDADREKLLESVLKRERDMSTCFGSGLAVPHGILPTGSGDGMVGAMGISREGLPFETPDDIPVHCVIVLATPAHQRDRHLQVLAALARSVGSDDNVRRQLFAAESAAHAYEILHLEKAHDFNYFLDDESEEVAAEAGLRR